MTPSMRIDSRGFERVPFDVKSMPKRRYTRSQEHQECIAFYDWYLLQQKRFLTPCICYHIANEYSGEYRPAFGNLLKQLGKLKGVLDYAVHTSFETFYLEFKSSKGRMSPEQIEFTERLDHLGIAWYVVRSSEEAREIFRMKGICA